MTTDITKFSLAAGLTSLAAGSACAILATACSQFTGTILNTAAKVNRIIGHHLPSAHALLATGLALLPANLIAIPLSKLTLTLPLNNNKETKATIAALTGAAVIPVFTALTVPKIAAWAFSSSITPLNAAIYGLAGSYRFINDFQDNTGFVSDKEDCKLETLHENYQQEPLQYANVIRNTQKHFFDTNFTIKGTIQTAKQGLWTTAYGLLAATLGLLVYKVGSVAHRTFQAEAPCWLKSAMLQIKSPLCVAGTIFGVRLLTDHLQHELLNKIADKSGIRQYFKWDDVNTIIATTNVALTCLASTIALCKLAPIFLNKEMSYLESAAYSLAGILGPGLISNYVEIN